MAVDEATVSLFGRKLSRAEILRRVGRLDQVAGVEATVLDEGAERGVRALRVRTGGGLTFTVLPDRGMDLGAAELSGLPLTWRSPTGVVAPWYREPQGAGFLRSFHGGLLVTCGLDNVGPASEDASGPVGVHGRLSSLPAEQVAHEVRWDERGGEIVIRGDVRQAAVFGTHLVLHRTLRARIGGTAIELEDRLENLGSAEAPFLLLYHVNVGWPLLEEGARLHGPGGSGSRPEPRDPDAASGLDAWDRFGPPTPAFRERVFYHRPVADAQGWARARLESPAAGGLDFSVRFRPSELPELVQWTMTGEGTYVLGLEPAVCRVAGYAGESAAGRVARLAPGATRTFRLSLAVDRRTGCP